MALEQIDYHLVDHNLKFEKIEMVDNDDLEYVKVEKVDADFGTMSLDDDIEYEKVMKADILDDDDDDYGMENEIVDKDEDEDVDEYEDMVYAKEDVEYSTPSRPKLSRDMDLKGIVKDIVLPFLPAKALAKFKSVSKEWDRWIKNPFLVHQQSYYFKGLSGFFCQHYGYHTFVSLDESAYGVPSHSLSFLPEEVMILSSCNGLLLCHGLDALDPYYVCNPATREWTHLPLPQLYHGSNSAAVLAFEPCPLNMNADYHLICLIPVHDHVYVEIYSSKTNSWKISEAILVDVGISTITGNCFYMKGIAYLETSDRKVIAFDLSSEVYEVIYLPRGAPLGGVLTQIRGELSYIGIDRSVTKGHFLKNEYTIKIFTGMNLNIERQVKVTLGPELDTFPNTRVLPCLDGDNVMVVIENFVYSYSMLDRSVEEVACFENVCGASIKYLPYVNSLVQVAKPF